MTDIYQSLEDSKTNPFEKMFTCRLINQVLTKTYFEFNSKLYKQKMGTTMDIRMAPSYANMFTKCLEKDLLELYNKKPNLWLRFIDDIFMIWPHGEEERKKIQHLYQQPSPNHQVHHYI